MPPSRKKLALLGAALAVTPGLLMLRAQGSDHADTPAIAGMPGVDLTDVYVFPNPSDANKTVLIMNVHPLIPAGASAGVGFDPDVLYQFKIDNTGDNVEDLVIQATFTGTGVNQLAHIHGPVAPARTGTVSELMPELATTGTINSTFSTGGLTVFTGAREDPFFFDLERFFQILPDRATPINGIAVPPAQANVPQKTSFRGFPQTEAGAGPPTDFLAGFNVLSIVIEVPKTQLVGGGSGTIGVWCTTSK
jgi:hypothetical protein